MVIDVRNDEEIEELTNRLNDGRKHF